MIDSQDPAHAFRSRPWALVTGGTRGIGRGLVRRFAAAGHPVVFTYQASVDAADSLVRDVATAGGLAIGHRCDCADDAAVRALADRLLSDLGPPHALINNVGITRDATLMQMASEQWHAVMRSNLDSAFFMARHFAAAMAERGDGVVLQMSSVAGIKGNVGQVNYSATKAALIGLTRSLALELARFNVRVNAVLPGMIETEMTAALPEAQQVKLRKAIPMRRFGTVDDVAGLCLFLASADAGYMTGQTFVVDGGLVA